MTDLATGPVAEQITARLTAALAPSHLDVANESAHARRPYGRRRHRRDAFPRRHRKPRLFGLSRVARQRLVNHALADLLATRIHALAIRAAAPGE